MVDVFPRSRSVPTRAIQDLESLDIAAAFARVCGPPRRTRSTTTTSRRAESASASLTEQIDTRSPSGQLVFHVFGALAEFERNLIRERTLAGLNAARARGRNGGRPKKLQSQATEDDSHSAALERSARAGYRRAVRRESIDPVP